MGDDAGRGDACVCTKCKEYNTGEVVSVFGGRGGGLYITYMESTYTDRGGALRTVALLSFVDVFLVYEIC